MKLLGETLGHGQGQEMDVVVWALNFRACENRRGWGGWASECCAAAVRGGGPESRPGHIAAQLKEGSIDGAPRTAGYRGRCFYFSRCDSCEG